MAKLWKTTVACMLVFSLILAGCGGKDKTTTADGKRILKVWGMGGEGGSLPNMVEAFEKANPDIDVQVQQIPWDSAHDKLLTAVASKNGPDVIQMGMTWIPEFANAGALLDLSSYTDKYPNLKPENFFEGARETMKYNDKLIAIPWYMETRVLYYRTDLLKEVGYDQAPKTWAELQDAAKKLAARGNGNYGILLDNQDAAFTLPFAWENGSEVISSDNKAQFNQKPYVEAVQYLTSFYKDGSAPSQSDMQLLPAFGQGIIPMFFSGPWSINQIHETVPQIDGKWATATIPVKDEGGKSASVLGGSNWSVFSSAANKDDAVKFVSFMSDPANQIEYYKLSKDLPSTLKAWDDKALDGEQIATFREQMKTSRPSPFVPQWEAVGQLIKAALQQIVVGGADVQTQMEDLNTQADALLQK